MTVLIVEKVSASLRGSLTRWMIQPKTGVFVGKVSARVREKLWERVLSKKKKGGAVLIYSCDTEQGYKVRSDGKTSKIMRDFEGVVLPTTPKKQ